VGTAVRVLRLVLLGGRGRRRQRIRDIGFHVRSFHVRSFRVGDCPAV